jgi:hypothetical protein
VIEVVLNQFPYPTADTPWEQIIDWRSDNDAQIKFRRLKHFVNTVSQRNDLNLKHLEDEILTLIDDYEQHMKIHKIKNNVGVFHGFVTTIPEILEDMIKLKFKDLSEIPFKLYERKVLKLEADMNAPGRELAYIVETKRNFGGS